VYSLPCLKKKYIYIYNFLLGGSSIYSKIKVNDGKQRQLVDNIFKQSSTSSTVPYFVGIAEFLTNVIPLICRSFYIDDEIVFGWIYWIYGC